MRTKEEIAKAFKADFQLLLNKYKAEFVISDHWQGYSECGQDIRAEITIESEYDENHELTQEWTEFIIDNYMTYEKE